VPALVGHLDEQVAVRGVGDRKLGKVAQHGLHQHVLEPDTGCAQRGALVAAVGEAFVLGHRVPRSRPEQRELLGRKVVGAVVDRVVPVDLDEGVEGDPLRGGHEHASF